MSKIFRVLILVFVFLFPRLAFPFWPIIGAGLALGSAVKAQYNGVMAELARINKMVSTAELVLLAVAIVVCLILILWSIRVLLKRRRYKKFQRFALALIALQTEVVFEKNIVSDTAKLKQFEQAKRDLIAQLEKFLQSWFFIRKLKASVREQMLTSLKLIKSGSSDYEHQFMLLDQLFRQISLLWV